MLGSLGSSARLREHLIFNGGTCLRKCYIADYRFSEDLDFTAVRGCRGRRSATVSRRPWSMDIGQAPAEDVRHR
ncbi:MAG: nucleotidyl transferase AbiEii/AbiGii toxin family protein [Gemmatimonadota bacterium]